MMNKFHSKKNIRVLGVVVLVLGSLTLGIYCLNCMNEREDPDPLPFLGKEELDRQALEDTTSQRLLASTPSPRENPDKFKKNPLPFLGKEELDRMDQEALEDTMEDTTSQRLLAPTPSPREDPDKFKKNPLPFLGK